MQNHTNSIEINHEIIGNQIQEILQENKQLRLKVQEQDSQLKASKIQYIADIKDLKNEVNDLENIKNEFAQIIQDITSIKNKIKVKDIRSNITQGLPLTPATSKKRRIEEASEHDNEDSPLSQTKSQMMQHNVPGNSMISDLHSNFPTQYSSDSNASIERPVYCQDKPGSPQLMYQGKPFEREDYTNSQFDMLPTQYSTQDNEDSIDLSKKIKIEEGSPRIIIKEEDKENFDEIEDSQDEFPFNSFELIKNSPVTIKREPLLDITTKLNSEFQSQPKHNIPEHYTKLQRREYLKTYYTSKFKNSPTFKINLNTNPINEMQWIINDFKLNSNYVKPRQFKKFGISKQEQNNIDKFYQLAGPLPKKQGLMWDDENLDSDEDSIELSESQILDKFPSPPGFMQSEFPDTQERNKRTQIIDERQSDRIERRLKQCLMRSKGKNGEFIFQVDILNQFVELNRFMYDS